MLNNFLWRIFRKAQTIFGARVKNGLFIKKRCILVSCSTIIPFLINFISSLDVAKIDVSADSNISCMKCVLRTGGCTSSPSRRSNRSCQSISWDLQWNSLRNMTSASSVPIQANDDVAGLSNVLNNSLIGFSINDFLQLVRPNIKIRPNFALSLSRSVLMELQKLFMQYYSSQGFLDSIFIPCIIAFLNKNLC